MKALSTRNDEPERASRPFDTDRDGFVMGEGAGVVHPRGARNTPKKRGGPTFYCELAGYGGLRRRPTTSLPPHPDGDGAARLYESRPQARRA